METTGQIVAQSGGYNWPAQAKCPRRHKYLRSQLRKLRVDLAAAVAERHGLPLTVMQLKLIGDVCRHEMAARLSEWKLAQDGGGMPVADFAALITKISGATDAGTRSLAKLGLDPKDGDIFDQLYNQPPTFDAASQTEPSPASESPQPADALAGQPGAG